MKERVAYEQKYYSKNMNRNANRYYEREIEK